MRLFVFLISFVIAQRVVELVVARRNERWMKEQGAIELGAGHYGWMVMMHVAFFVALIAEILLLHRQPPSWVAVPFVIFFCAQAIRIWALWSLGRFWNTKILVLPGASVVRRGPYRFIRHPNYFVVTVELLALPLVFQAYWTALLFTLLNVVILSVRIPMEERALNAYTDYPQSMAGVRRFRPGRGSE